MALYGENYTLAHVDVPASNISVKDAKGKIRVLHDKYTFVADVIAINTEIYMGKIPKGAKIYDVLVWCGDLGTTGLLHVGWGAGADAVEAADADGFFASLDVKAAARLGVAMSITAKLAGQFKEFSEEVDLIVKLAEAADSADTEVLEVVVLYTLD